MNGIYEILSNKYWMAPPQFIHGVKANILKNLEGHIALNLKDKRICGRAFIEKDGQITIEDQHVSAKDGSTIYSWRDNANDPFVDILYADGPITRNGDGCSYGSIEMRDMMMQAAEDANCVGHIFYINTPGGSAWAINDFKQAIDYAREKKQPVYAFIDGMCCSAGMYLAAMTDGIYYMHPNDEIGCVGVMAAFYTIANGAKNQFDESTYHEIYADNSVWKNKEMRDIANDGNDEMLRKELNDLEAEFVNDVKAARPNADIEEHLRGKVFKAKEVEGILVDGQAYMGDVIALCIDQADKNGLQSAKNAKQTSIYAEGNKADAQAVNVSPNNNTDMNQKYETIANLAGVSELIVTEEGTFLNAPLLDTLAANIEALQAQAAKAEAEQPAAEKAPAAEPAAPAATEEAPASEETPAAEEEQPAAPTNEEAPAAPASEEAPATPANEETPAEGSVPSDSAAGNDNEDAPAAGNENTPEAALHTAEQMLAEKDATIASLTKAAEETSATIATMKAAADQGAQEIAQLKAQVEALTTTVAKQKQALAEKESEIKELAGQPAPMTDGSAGVPAGNGTGEPAKPKTVRAKAGMTYEEIRALKKSQQQEQ